MIHLDTSHVSTRHQCDVDGWKAAPVVKLASVCKVLVLCLGFLFISTLDAEASHFRYGNITWRVVSGNTIEFKVSQAWRYSFYYPSRGQTLTTDYLFLGNGTRVPVNLTVTSINTAEDWFYGEAIIRYTYPSAGNYTSYFSSCCKISNLQNNPNGSWRVETVVTVGNGNNSPVTTSPAIINLPVNVSNASTTLAVTDPDGDPLSFRSATYSEMMGYNPSGFSVNAQGVITFNTVGKSVGQLWNAAVAVTDSKGAKVVVDFIIKITQQSTAPAFDNSVTPVSGTIYQVAPGQSVNFSVKATDSDPGDNVQLQAVGLPIGSTVSPALPVSGNPAQTSFSWTPTSSNLGTNVISFIAQDNQGVQTTSSVTILVSLKPVFDVPPTPAANSYIFTSPGSTLNYSIQASDPDPNDLVQIISANVAGATVSPLPSTAGNPSSAQFSWSPQVANWGENVMTFTAEDTYGDRTNHKFTVVVNSAPAFISSPLTSVVAGQPYLYTISASDADMPYGDVLRILAAGLPAWLTLTDNGDGTATLSGTPQVADAGMFNISVTAEDNYHHQGGVATQAFQIEVIPCNMSLAVSGTDISCNGKSDGAIGLIITGGTASYSISWTGPDNFTSSDEDPSGLVAGIYTVVVTDANDCMERASITLNQPLVELPQITAPADIALATDAGSCGAVVNYTAPVGTHSCHMVSTVLTVGLPSGDVFPVGNTLVSYTVTDAAGNSATASFTVTVTDSEKPSLVLPTNISVANDAGSCGAAVPFELAATDNCGSATVTADRASGAVFPIGTTTVHVTAEDAVGNVSTGSFTITVADKEMPVIANLPANITVGNDPGRCEAVVSWAEPTASDNCAGVTLSSSHASGSTFAVGTTTTVYYTATDAVGNAVTQSFDVTVTNDVPFINSLSASVDPVQISTAVSVTATYTDNNLLSASWNWGDGNITSGAIDHAAQVITGTHTYSATGVYTVELTITDACNESVTSPYQYVVVYDPNGGFVTGGGWINSPAGAYVADPSLMGKANWGFVSKYKRGATVPDGNTQFEFKAAELNFKSTSYEWLVISGYKAQYKGEGTINEMGGYGFILSAVDGAKKSSTEPDRFRIKIWNKLSGAVVYDNQIGDADDAEASTAISGGSIVIHDGGSKNSANTREVTAEYTTLQDFAAYPNPLSQHGLWLEFPAMEEGGEVKAFIFDLSGRLMTEKAFVVEKEGSKLLWEVEHSNWSGGIYILLIQGEKIRQQVKLIK